MTTGPQISDLAAEVFLRAMKVDDKVGAAEFDAIPKNYLNALFATELQEVNLNSLIVLPFQRVMNCYRADVNEMYGGLKDRTILARGFKASFYYPLMMKPSTRMLMELIRYLPLPYVKDSDQPGLNAFKTASEVTLKEKALQDTLNYVGMPEDFERSVLETALAENGVWTYVKNKTTARIEVLNQLLYSEELSGAKPIHLSDQKKADWVVRGQNAWDFKEACEALK